MKEFIMDNLANGETISMAVILLNNAAALLVAFFIMFTYKITCSGAVYNGRFNRSLGALLIITTMIMSVISNNVALSLGMVGALSIIRFRTAVKDVRDAVFIFWTIAAGIGCGVSQYSLVIVGSAFVMAFFVLTGQTAEAGQQLLVIEGKPEIQREVMSVLEEYYGSRARLTMKNVTDSSCEMIFRVGEKEARKAAGKQTADISELVLGIEGVRRFNQIEQQDDISRS